MMSRLEVGTSYSYIALALVVTALGMGTTMPPATAAIMSGVPMAKAGVGSAMNDTTRELGGALGVAVIGSLLSSHYTSAVAPALAGLPDKLRELAQSSVGGAIELVRQGAAPPALADAAKRAFVDGMQLSLVAAAGFALAASLFALWLLPAEVHHGRADGHGLPDQRLDGLPVESPAHAGAVDMDTV
jgi:hypothetical protein